MVGTLYSWSLTVRGTATNPLLNNPHVPPTATDHTFAAFTKATSSQLATPTTATGKPPKKFGR